MVLTIVHSTTNSFNGLIQLIVNSLIQLIFQSYSYSWFLKSNSADSAIDSLFDSISLPVFYTGDNNIYKCKSYVKTVN